MAAFLSDGDVYCHHEALKHDDYEERMKAPYRLVGNSDCMGMFGPEMKTVAIMRPLREVRASLDRLGLNDDLLSKAYTRLVGMDALKVPFNRLDDEMERICHYLNIPYNPTRHAMFRLLNIQTTDFSEAPCRLSSLLGIK